MMSPLLLRLAVSVSTPQRRNVHDSRRALAANYNNYTSDRKKKSDNENDTPEMHIRLSKRMSELGICSRREAARILYEVNKCNDRSLLKDLKEVIYLRGMPVMDGAAVKVPPDEKYIEIRSGDDPPHERVEPGRNESCVELKEFIPYPNRPWKEIMGDTIILHKPIGYVSGQEEHQHVPAVRLLNRENMHLSEADKDMHAELRNGDALHFDRWKFSGYDVKANSVPKHIRMTLDEEQLSERNSILEVQTLSGYAPAGRLDIDSSWSQFSMQAVAFLSRVRYDSTTSRFHPCGTPLNRCSNRLVMYSAELNSPQTRRVFFAVYDPLSNLSTDTVQSHLSIDPQSIGIPL